MENREQDRKEACDYNISLLRHSMEKALGNIYLGLLESRVIDASKIKRSCVEDNNRG